MELFLSRQNDQIAPVLDTCGWHCSVTPLSLFLPQGGTHFQLVPPGSPQGYFMGKFSPLTSIKFLPPMPPSKSDPNYSPLKKLKRLEKIDFQHTTITLGLVNK